MTNAVEHYNLKQLNVQQQNLPLRPADAHKGLFGHLLVLGGNTGMGGAAMLATEAALRSGAGLVSCATKPEHVTALLVRTPTAMVRGVESSLEVLPLLAQANALAIGPGLGQDGWAQLLLQQALNSILPMVLDADGLNLLAQKNIAFTGRSVILTPHPGEAARLLKTNPAQVQSDRLASALALAAQYQAVVVLKGHDTVVASPDGQLAVCTDGNAGMSGAGMGDVLAGVLGALLAQGLSAWQAARLGVALHASAGDAAAQAMHSRAPYGLLATDLLTLLPAQIN